MEKLRKAKIYLLSMLLVSSLLIFLPRPASAHEVYVLNAQEVASAISMPSPNPFSAVPSQELLFLLSGAIAVVIMLVVLHFSVSKLFERVFDPILIRLKKFAPIAGRLTLGTSLIASGYYHALFGPELPFAQFAGSAAGIVSAGFIILGIAILLGFYARAAAFVALCFFAYSVFRYQAYMLTYLNYFGEIILALILGGGKYSLDHFFGFKSVFAQAAKSLEKYAFLILRICFGTAVFFASFYAKFLHSNLALDTVLDYHLVNYFHFTPLFLVLGAFIVEALIGLCIVAGFEVRFATMVFSFFLTLSLCFFGEVVWPHIVLFGVNIALFLHGYDEFTLEKRLFSRGRKNAEPVF